MADIEETIDAGNLELRRKRIDYYKTLKRVWLEFGEVCTEEDYKYRYPDNFVEWVEETYGFKVTTDHMGNFTSEYTVVDEPKYTMFLLKYSK